MNKAELLAKRANVLHQMEDVKKRASDESRLMTPEERSQWDGWKKEFDEFTTEIRSIDDMNAMKAQIIEGGEAKKVSDTEARSTQPSKADQVKAYVASFRKAFLYGLNELTPEERSILKTGHVANYRTGPLPQTTAPDAQGGYLVPEEWASQIYKFMSAYGPLVNIGDSGTGSNAIFNLLQTSTGVDFNFPTNNDIANKGRRIAEAGARTLKDTEFANVAVGSYAYTSDIIQVSAELARDSAFNLPLYLAGILAERLGRIMNDEFTNADGSSKPQGIVTGSTLGHTATAAAALERADFVKLMYSVNAAYRSQGSFMFSSDVEEALMLLPHGSTDERPLWAPSFREGSPDTVLGRPYYINDDMDEVAASKKPILFGDMSKFIVRLVGQPVIRFSSEYGWANNVLSWEGTWYGDSRILDNTAIKHLLTPAS
jgi:HK97 family phage major capsid protein